MTDNNREPFLLAPGITCNGGFMADTGYGVNLNVARGSDLVVLAGNRGGGYIPYCTLLPHQVYQKTLERDFAEHNFDVIYAIPVRSDEPILIAGRDQKILDKYVQYDNKPKRFELTADIHTSLEELVYGTFNVVEGERAIYDFMQAFEALAKERVKKAVQSRDDEWENQLNHVRGSLKYV